MTLNPMDSMLKLFDKDYLKTTAETKENANDYELLAPLDMLYQYM